MENCLVNSVCFGDTMLVLEAEAEIVDANQYQSNIACCRSVSHEAAHSRPTYNVTDAEKRAADDFLTVPPPPTLGPHLHLSLHMLKVWHAACYFVQDRCKEGNWKF